jgi:hypothetical protein
MSFKPFLDFGVARESVKRERERDTHTHTHRQREREGERERELQTFSGFWSWERECEEGKSCFRFMLKLLPPLPA